MPLRVALCAGLTLLAAASLAADPPPRNIDDALRQLLQVADDRGPQAAATALRRHQAARLLADDGRADYAHALVLLRLNKVKESLAPLSRAAAKNPPNLLALRAWVALLMQQKQWATTSEQLDRLGRAFAAQPAWWPDDDSRARDAEWLGRAISVAQLIVPAATDVKRFADLDGVIRKSLPAELRTRYSAGFEAVLTESETLAEVTAAAEVVAKVEQQAEQDANRQRVKDQQSQANSERENLKLTAEEWKKHLDDKLADFAKQLGTLERNWNTQDQKRQSIERSIFLAGQEQTLLISRGQQVLQQNQAAGRNNITVGTSLPAFQAQMIDRQLGILQQQITQYQFERSRVLTEIASIHQQAQTALSQQQKLIAEYEQATGKLVQKDDNLKKWADRLAKKEKDLPETPKGKAPSVQSLEQKRKSVSTYLPMDWEAERQRWLKELSSE